MHCIRRGRGRFTGFTLIELLVVVAIIALLIGILLPTLSRAREQSKKTACLANLRGMGQAMAVYAGENADFLPNLNPPLTVNDSIGVKKALVDVFFVVYLKNPKLMFCPCDTDKAPVTIDNADYLTPNSARMSYDFYSIWWMPEKGPKLPKIDQAPLAWDLDGGDPAATPQQNHGRTGGHVVYGNGSASWQPVKEWDDGNWPHPANEYYQ